MNTQQVDAIARAVLYEGYMLYPYRPSALKNRQRFNFGVLYPRTYAESLPAAEPWDMQTECLILGADARVEVEVRFLKLIERSVSRLADPASEPQEPPGPHLISDEEPAWQEASECNLPTAAVNVQQLLEHPVESSFDFPANQEVEAVNSDAAGTIGIVTRRQKRIRGRFEIRAAALRSGLFRLRLHIGNLTDLDNYSGRLPDLPRNGILPYSLVSVHAILGVEHGKFVSLLETPEEYQQDAVACENRGLWPVLVGEPGQRDTLLSSPIILYDYPQVAPESPGDLFDGAEIDEILALRIMTMTEEEKREARASDERARKLLDRTDSLSYEQLAKLHGTLRDLHPVKEKAS